MREHVQACMVLYCHECRDAGRDDRNLHFSNDAVTPSKRKGWTP
ncbi:MULTISPECIES: hypothetical protein [unclassified Mesorhizobium]|nr:MULTISPECIES: hypothetical protein [unclassified Mesorhizobium]